MSIQFNMEMSDLVIRVECRYDTTEKFCSDYFTDKTDYDIFACATEEEIKKEAAQISGSTERQAEQLCIYRSIAKKLPDFNRLVFHGASITYKDTGLLFTAPSGTGKTTHIRLWKKSFGDDVLVVNGDKPILKIEDTVTVYGTPWAGKENYQLNRSAPLKALCVVKQGTENEVKRISGSDAVTALMQQIYLPKEPQALKKTLTLLNNLIKTVPCFVASVDMSEDAVKATYNAMINM